MKSYSLPYSEFVQEQLNNILKHAKATCASIQLSKRDDEIILTISDNGEGCNTLEEQNGIGNINIKSRVESYHGTVTIASKPGEGYELSVTLPLHCQLLIKSTGNDQNY